VIVCGLCALAVAALAVTPIAALAAASPSPATLRAALADPIDRNFIEADVGTAGTLEGPFDAESYASYYELAGLDVQTAQSLVRSLHSNGFVGGYGRQWYQPRATEYLGELVMGFTRSSGASSIASASKIRYGQDHGFQSFVEPHLSKGSFAVTETSSGYQWTVVIFLKGNDLFAIAQGSTDGFMTDQALAQARRAYDHAPTSIGASAQSNSPTGLGQAFRLIAAVGLMLLLAVATVVAVIVFVVRTPRPRPPIAVEPQPKL
jgi:hypothetical protein